jgi:hypothetical protein
MICGDEITITESIIWCIKCLENYPRHDGRTNAEEAVIDKLAVLIDYIRGDADEIFLLRAGRGIAMSGEPRRIVRDSAAEKSPL